MVLESLGNSLKKTLSKVKNSLTVDRDLVDEVIKEIQKSLLTSDVDVHLVLELTQNIRKRAVEENIESFSKKEHLVTIIYEELSKLLGEGEEFSIKENQNRILLVGLYGQGKTTTCAKLGLYFKNRSKKVALISTDTYRPAAFEQLKQLGEKQNIDVFGNPNVKDAVKIYEEFEKQLKNYDVVLIDSCGRDSLNSELILEISNLKEKILPTDTFFVLGADVGQTAKVQAETFKKNVDVTGVIITKLDGTGKGGGAISSCKACDVFIKFIGVGEKAEDFERFNSKRFVSELLGMGDIEGLLEKAEIAMQGNTKEKLEEKFARGEFDLNDLCEQMKSIKKMGSMSKMMSLIPGFGSLNVPKEEMKKQENKIKAWEYMVSSMTEFERKNPDCLEISRLKRITKGSGCPMGEARDMLKQYKQMKKMFSMMKDGGGDFENMKEEDLQNLNQNDMMGMMKKFGGGKMMKKMMKGRRGK